MKYALERQSGSDVVVISSDAMPQYLTFLGWSEEVQCGMDMLDVDLSTFDAVVCLDLSVLQQLSNRREADFSAFAQHAFTVNIDHHATNNGYGVVNIVDNTRSSTCELLTDLFLHQGIAIDRELARRLMVGICSDTAFFRVSLKTPSRTFALMAALLEYGVDYERDIIDPLLNHENVNRKKYLGLILTHVKEGGQGRYCYSIVSQEDLCALNLGPDDASGGADYLRDIEGFEYGLTLVESPDGWRGSIRAKPGRNILSLANRLGGGGHPEAAGFRLPPMSAGAAEAIILNTPS